MQDSPRKQQSTSRVIDSLHSQIDGLKHDMEVLTASCRDYQKRSTTLASKNDSLVDQLANCKHENDMVNALIKRKERRIADLEAEFSDLNLESESMKQTMKNYKIRCDNLQESSASSTAEFERLKISYDALVAAQGEYKRHYQEELNKVSTQLETYKLDSSRAMADLTSKFGRNDKDIDALLEGLHSKRTSMDNMVVHRNKSVLGLLSLLAKVAKTHGEECQSILLDNVQIIGVLREKFPEVSDCITERISTMINVDDLLRDSAASLDTPFADLDVKSTSEPTRQPSRTLSQQNSRRNRNAVRLSPDTSVSELQFPDSLPRQRVSSRGQASRGSSENGTAGAHHQLQRRSYSQQQQNSGQRNNSGGRQILSGLQGNPHRGSGNAHNRNISGGNNTSPRTSSNSSQAKRRLFNGGSNNYNIGAGEKYPFAKANEASLQPKD